MNRKLNLLTAISFFFCLSTFAQAPKYSNEFLSIGVGARALGMSNSYVASANDVTAGYWNPAGLGHVTGNLDVGLMHNEYFGSIGKYDYVGVAAPINSSSTICFSLMRFGIDNIPNTLDLIDANGQINYDRVKSFSAVDYAFLFSYARKSKVPGLKYGANVKIIHRIVGEFAQSWGFGLDAGAQYETNSWRFGVMARDVTSTFNAWNFTLDEHTRDVFKITENEIPSNSVEVTLPKIIFGVAKKINIYKKFSCLPEIDLDITTDGMRNVLVKSDPFSIDPHIGVEFAYSDFIFVRGGISNIQDVTDTDGKKVKTVQPAIGIGIRIKRFTIDYAMSDVGDKSIGRYSNVFSVRFNFVRNEKGR